MVFLNRKIYKNINRMHLFCLCLQFAFFITIQCRQGLNVYISQNNNHNNSNTAYHLMHYTVNQNFQIIVLPK